MSRIVVLLLLFSVTCHVALAVYYETGGEVPNGGFEKCPSPSDLDGTKLTSPNGIPDWETTGCVEYIKSGATQDHMLLIVPAGMYAVRLGNDAAIKQKLTLTPGMFYSLTFSAARTCGQQEKLKVSVSPCTEAGGSGVLPIQTVYSSNGWDSYSWGFVAEADQVEISIHNPGDDKEDAACGPLIDSVALVALPPIKRTAGNLLRNGNFETGPYISPNTSWGVLVPSNIEDAHCPLIGWSVISLKAVKYIDYAHYFVPVGNRAVQLMAGRESIIVQIVRTMPNKVYDLTFAVGDACNSCEGSMVVEAFAGKESFKVPYESSGKGGFKRAKLRFTASSMMTRVKFLSSYYHMKSDHSGSLCGPVVDDVKLVLVNAPPQHKHA
ncbi:protein DUF642 L-GALACTONO-1,4-LACTONE-RESPONSIVE GENE 2-like [Rhododendron vialii]|uniref:protein DUF642 L-GALACTONO-1,4-LACTONE-RESPONSIVE GENE 2-like n=1 Tax=Rhododendron vialii TaxID=182163 RepID=UPI00265ED6CB|nr:protein DUF642 L-GALACTONO-1,4-LACTONE-RESPONSIVE GENE 2-like [Rhododendron vialii]